jgi:predicted phage-related endonuclease
MLIRTCKKFHIEVDNLPEIEKPVKRIATDSTINNAEDYRTKYEQLLERTNEQLSTALATVLTISKGVETSLNKAIKDQEGYHVSIAANQEVIFDALDEIRHAPAGQLSQTADNVRHERLLKISGKDSIGV